MPPFQKLFFPAVKMKDYNDLTRKQRKVKTVCYTNFANVLVYGSLFSEGGMKTWREIA